MSPRSSTVPSVWTEGTLANAENSLRELSRLAETAGSVVLDGLVQRRGRPDPATYIGSGKAAEIASLVTSLAADTVICDGELSPSQLRRLEGVVKVKVIDRTALILDIFAQHARSKEGKAQVELAQLEYLLPRLRGWGESLSRQAGGRVAGGRLTVRYARPGGAPGPDPVRPVVYPHRHGRLRQAPAASAGRGVPLDTRGGRGVGPDRACGRRQRRRPAGADRGRP